MSNPTIAQVRAALKARFEAITDIGRVHDYERYAKQEGAVRALYVATIGTEEQLRGMHLRRVSTHESYQALNRWHIHHHWQARLFMAFNDADKSEHTFDTLIETIRDSFRANPEIIGDLRKCDLLMNEDDGGVQVIESQPVLFAGVLCHSARLAFTTRQLE